MANGGNIKYSVSFDVNKAGLNEIKTSLQEIQRLTAKDLIKVDSSNLNSVDAELKNVKKSASQLEEAFDKAFNTDLGTLNVAKFNQELKKLDLNKIYKDFSSIGTVGQDAFRNMTTQILTTNMQLKQTHNFLNEMATTMANTIKWGVASSVMNNFSGSVQQAYGYVKSLDHSLNDIRIVTGYSADEMDKFAEKANKAAKALGQSTTDYTNASLIYYQQGLSDSEVEARTETTLKAANVTGQTGEQVSEQLTAVWNGYKVTSEEAELYVDKLAAVAASTASDLEELSVGMSKVASAADLMGVDVDQLNATLATVVSVTRQAPESVGTAFKTIYARMGDIEAGLDTETTLGDYTQKMKEIAGIDVLDANNQLRDMGEVVEEVGNKWSSFSREQQLALSQAMAGTRQYNNLLSLFDNWDMYKEALQTSADAQGTLQEQQDIYMESTAAHLKQLKTESEDLYDSLLDADSVNLVADGLTLVVKLMSNFVDSIGGGSGALIGLGSIATRVFSQQIASGVTTFINNFRVAKDNVNQLAAQLEIVNMLQNSDSSRSDTQVADLVAMKKQILDLDKATSQEEEAIANNYIKQKNTLYEQENALKTRREEIEAYYKQITEGESLPRKQDDSYDIENIAETLNQRANEIDDQVYESINESDIKKAYQDVSTAINEYIRVGIEGQEQTGQLQTAMDRLKDTVAENASVFNEQIVLAEKLRDSDEIDIVSKEKLAKEIEKLNDLRDKDNQLNYSQKKVIEQVNKVEEARVAALQKKKKALQEAAKDVLTLSEAERTQKSSLDLLNSSWTQFLSQINLKAKIQSVVDLAGAFGQVASAFNTVRQIGSIWSNEDLSTGEKILQTVTNLGFALPMLASSIGQVNQVLGIGTSLTTTTTAATEAAYAAQAKRTGMETLFADAMAKGATAQQAYTLSVIQSTGAETEAAAAKSILTQLSQGKMTQEQAETAINQILAQSNFEVGVSAGAAAEGVKAFLASLGPIGWIFIAVGAISGLVAIFDKLTTSAEEAGEALTDSIKAYEDVTKELESLESELSTTKDRMTELLELASKGELSLTEEKELAQLQAENAELESKIALLKKEQELKQKEIVSSANTAQKKGTYDVDDKGENQAITGIGYGPKVYQVGDETFQADIPVTSDIKLSDESTFLTWKDSMEGLIEQVKQKQSTVEDEDTQEQWGMVIQDLENTLTQVSEEYSTAREERLSDYQEDYQADYREGYDKAKEVLPALKENNTNGENDEAIAYWESKIHDYLALMGTLEDTIFSTIENLNLTSEQEKNLQTNENIIDREKQTVNEKALKDTIGEENFETLKNYSDGIGLSLYDILQTFQDMSGMIGLSSEEIEKKLTQNRIDEITEAAQETSTSKANLTALNPDIMKNTLSEKDLENWELIVQYIDGATVNTKGWTVALKEAAKAAAEAKEELEFEDKISSLAEEYADAYEIEEEAFENLAKKLHEDTDAFEGLNKELATNGDLAIEVAKDILRFDKACESVKDSSEDWMKALKSGNIQDISEAMDEMADAYGNLMDIDGSLLSNDFLTNIDNLNLMEQAVNGNEDAYNQLMEAARQDIAMTVGFDDTAFQTKFNGLMNEVHSASLETLEIGADLDNGKFLEKLTNMVNEAGMSAEQATSYLSSMGVDATIETQENNETETSEYTDAIPKITMTEAVSSLPMLSKPVKTQIPSVSWDFKTNPTSSKKQTKATALKVTSAHKSSGGNFKYKNSSHGSGNKGASKSSGGGGSTSKPKVEKKTDSKKDRYHDVDVTLKQLDQDLSKIGDDQDKLFGKDLIDALNKELKILEKQRDVLKEKLAIAKQEQKEIQDSLAKEGVLFNEDGTIKNYMAIMDAKENALNAVIDKYNAMSSEAQEEYQDTLDEAKEQYEDFVDMLEDYDDLLLDTIPDIEDSLQEITDREIEINIQKFNMEVELRLDLTEAQKDWNEFKRNILDGIDSEDIFGNALKDAELFKTILKNETTEALTNNIKATVSEIQSINTKGYSDLYGTDKNAALENLDDQMSNLMDHLTELADLEEEIADAYLDMIDEVGEAFDKQIESYEFVGDLIEHNLDMVQLLNGDDSYKELSKIYEEQEKNNLQRIAAQKQAVDYYKQMMEIETDSEALKEWTELWEDAVSDLNSLVEDSVETIIDKYTNTINVIFDELNDKLTNGQGLDFITQQWDLQNTNADQYLDTINRTYEIQKLEKKIQESIDSSDSLYAQKQLNKLMDDELKKLKEKDKLTQYDVDRANQMYEIKLKEIALEEAQKNKSQMRLRRDASGNYSYQFVADQDSISKAQQELDDARNSLYNMDKDKYRENQQAILDVYTEFQEKMRNAADLSAEERALIEEEYTTRINNLLEENGYIRLNLMESTFMDLSALYNTDVSNFQLMSDTEKEVLMNQIIPNWDSGIQMMIDKMAGEGGFGPTCKDAFYQLDEATKEYNDSLGLIEETAGTSFEAMANGYNENLDLAGQLADAQQENINRTIEEKDAIGELKIEVEALKTEYDNVYESAKKALEAAQALREAEKKAAAEAAAEEERKRLEQQQQAQAGTGGGQASTSEGTSNDKSVSVNNIAIGDKLKFVGGTYFYDSSGMNPTGNRGAGKTVIVENINKGAKYPIAVKSTDSAYGWLKENQLQKYDTGGYTGDWNGEEGKPAILHKKELVLNADDTKNFLSAIKIVRDMESILESLNDSMLTRTTGMTSTLFGGYGALGEAEQTVNQNVQIQASFPGVSVRSEIEQAFENLVNTASQHAFNTQR